MDNLTFSVPFCACWFCYFFKSVIFLYFLPVGESIMISLLLSRLALMRLRGVACLRLVSTVWLEFYATYRNWEWLLIQVIIIRIIIHVCTCIIHSLLLEQYFFRDTTKLTCTCILIQWFVAAWWMYTYMYFNIKNTRNIYVLNLVNNACAFLCNEIFLDF